MIIYKCWTKLRWRYDKTILTNSKWCIGQLKLKTVHFPHSAQVAKANSTQLTYNSSINHKNTQSHARVINRCSAATSPPVCRDFSPPVGAEQGWTNRGTSSKVFSSHRNGSTPDPEYESQVACRSPTEPRVLSTSLALARGIHIPCDFEILTRTQFNSTAGKTDVNTHVATLQSSYQIWMKMFPNFAPHKQAIIWRASTHTITPGRDKLQPRRRQVRYSQQRHERKHGARQPYSVKNTGRLTQ